MRDLASRIAAHWWTKLWLGGVLGIGLCGGYWAAQRIELATPRTLPSSVIDRLAPFAPAWTGVYLSMYAMLPLAWLARSRDDLRRYAIGFLIIAIIGFAAFILVPIEGPRVASDDRLLSAVQRWDFPRNAMPSLHVALAVYSGCFAMRVTAPRVAREPARGVSREKREQARGLRGGNLARRVFAVSLVAWVLLIAYSTLAIRQHYAVDLPPGALLGWAGHRLAWRGRSEASVQLAMEAA